MASPEPRPSMLELTLVFLTGLGHVVLELSNDGMKGAADSIGRPQHIYNLSAGVVWTLYLIWRGFKVPGMRQAWGFRREGFKASLKPGIIFGVIALVPLLLYGHMHGRLPLPASFWLVLGLYPLYGIAQQFALQALITRNLRDCVPRLPLRVLTASILFSLAHFPTWWLMALTFIAGLAFTWIFEKHRNLWAIGIIHGILGSVAYYLVIGQDPGAEILGWFGSQ